MDIKVDTTSYSLDVFITDTTGAPETGLAFGTAGLVLSYHRPGATVQPITLVTQTVAGAWSSGGFVELDATNLPGWYRLDVPNAALVSGVDFVTIGGTGTSIVVIGRTLQFTGYNPRTDLTTAVLARIDENISAAKTLTAGSVQAIWDALTAALTTVGSVGKLLTDNINATIGSRSSHTAADVWAAVVRTITGGTITTNSDKTGYSLSNGSIAAATFAADASTYQAKIELFDDDNGTTDRYAVVFFKNSQPVTAGITVPTIQVIKVADGTDLIASVALTQIGALGLYRYSATAAERITSGVAYIAKVTATIDGSTRTWYQPVGRDSV